MSEYLIAFNDEWVPDHTVEELREKSAVVGALVVEMKAAGVLIFTGGLDDAAPVFSVDASSGSPTFTDGPFVESTERLGGFAVVDVPDEEAARLWAGRIAVACGWPQEVSASSPMHLPNTCRETPDPSCEDGWATRCAGTACAFDRAPFLDLDRARDRGRQRLRGRQH